MEDLVDELEAPKSQSEGHGVTYSLNCRHPSNFFLYAVPIFTQALPWTYLLAIATDSQTALFTAIGNRGLGFPDSVGDPTKQGFDLLFMVTAVPTTALKGDELH